MKNMYTKVIKLYHKNLKRFDDGVFKSYCPFCEKGILLVARNSDTLILEAEDMCFSCGQRIEYLDIDELRKS